MIDSTKPADVGIPAAAYVRMSTAQQEESPAIQREQIKTLASREGYRITKFYEDMGISGGSNNRPAYDQLQDDAELGLFHAILCWDKSRLSRQDILDAAESLKKFRVAGVMIHTVRQGTVDLNNPQELLMHSVDQFMNDGFLRQQSANVSAGMQKKAKSGRWVQGRPPFG